MNIDKLKQFSSNINYPLLLKGIQISLNLEALLEYLKCEEVEDVGDDYKLRCPNPYHLDKNPSAYIHKEDFVWNCFSCGSGGDLIHFIKTVLQVDHFQAMDFLKEFTGIDETSDILLEVNLRSRIKQLNGKSKKEEKVDTFLPSEFKLVKEGVSSKGAKYLFIRGIPIDVAEKYNIGYCLEGWYRDRLIVPIYYGGKLVSFAARAMLEEEKWEEKYGEKYKKNLFAKGPHIKNFIFNLTNEKQYAIVSEGVFDAIKITMAGFSGVCTFSNKISDEQAEILSRLKNIFIMPDNKHGGELLVEKAIEKLIHRVPLYRMKYNSEDPGDSSIEEIKNSFENAERIK